MRRTDLRTFASWIAREQEVVVLPMARYSLDAKTNVIDVPTPPFPPAADVSDNAHGHRNGQRTAEYPFQRVLVKHVLQRGLKSFGRHGG